MKKFLKKLWINQKNSYLFGNYFLYIHLFFMGVSIDTKKLYNSYLALRIMTIPEPPEPLVEI